MNIPLGFQIARPRLRDPDNTRARYYCRAFRCGSQRGVEGGGKAVYFSPFCGFIFFYDFFANEGEKGLLLFLPHQGQASVVHDRRRAISSPLLSSEFQRMRKATKISSCRIKKEPRGKMSSGIFSTSAISKESRRIVNKIRINRNFSIRRSQKSLVILFFFFFFP